MTYTLAELADLVDGEVVGDPQLSIGTICSLSAPVIDGITFLSDQQYLDQLKTTTAAAVILQRGHLDLCPVSALVTDHPYSAYARIAASLHPVAEVRAGINASAVVDPSALIDASAEIAAGSIVEAGVTIGKNVFVGPRCVIARNAQIAADSRLIASVFIGSGTILGQRVIIQPGAVIGADGFGHANQDGQWLKIPQIGRVVLGNDVEVGANTTIDRGTIGDTVLEDGVKIDNLVQIGHNVKIGRDSAAAACVGIAGSATIGERCTLSGGVGIVGHLSLADDVHITGFSMVTHNIHVAGVYSSGLSARPNRDWNRTVARINRLDKMAKQVKALEYSAKLGD